MDNIYVLLIAAGVVILLGVMAQGFWQSHKASKMLQGKESKKIFETEPGLEGSMTEGADQDYASPFYDTFGLLDSDFYTSMVDPLIDVIVEITLDVPIQGKVAMLAMPVSRQVGSKQMHFEGYNQGAKSWEPFNPDEKYQQIQVALQLANRSGAVTEIEFSEFIRIVQNYADQVNGGFEAPDMLETVSRAKELDQFACDYDARINIHLVSNTSAWSPAYLQQQASGMGFVAGSQPGRMVIPAAQTGAPPVLALHYDAQTAMADDPNTSPITSLIVGFDVMQTSRQEEPFKTLYHVVTALSKNLEASIVDEAGVPLDAEAFTSIYKMLETLYDELERRGLDAGSGAARRLFS